jgi:uncharacterized Zn-binding protein involved in type VI secretion
MSGKPAARLGDPTACPLPGHGVNPIAAGSPNVFFDGMPAARQGDPTACGSVLSANVIPNVLINNQPATVVGTLGSHGNVIIGGSGTVIIGNTHTPAPFTPPAPLSFQKTYGQSFNITDRSGQPLLFRDYLATVNGVQVQGTTDAKGVAHIKSPTPDAQISIHVKFRSPARMLDELSESQP